MSQFNRATYALLKYISIFLLYRGLSRYIIIFKYLSNFVVTFYSKKLVSETYAVKTVKMRNNSTFKNNHTPNVWIMMQSIGTHLVSFFSTFIVQFFWHLKQHGHCLLYREIYSKYSVMSFSNIRDHHTSSGYWHLWLEPQNSTFYGDYEKKEKLCLFDQKRRWR